MTGTNVVELREMRCTNQWDAFYRGTCIITVSSLPPSLNNLNYLPINAIQHRFSVPNNLLRMAITQYVDVSIFIKPILSAFEIWACSEASRLFITLLYYLVLKEAFRYFD